MSSLSNYFQALADKIRSKTGKTDSLTPEQMISEIDVIYDKGREDYILEKTSLKFSSDESFTLSVSNPGWGGALEYTLDKGNSWNTWKGSQLSGTAEQPIYLRGIGNTIIAGGYDYRWTFTGKYCTGNIETLLDYQTVMQGQHPTLGAYCYANMFMNCESLVVAPELPATTLTYSCYSEMFSSCYSLTTAPKLPATTLAEECYKNMFMVCDSLTTLPKLPATTLAESCYASMFYMCHSLKLSTTQTGEYQYPYRIPTSGTGTTASYALASMFSNTGGTFKGVPTINTTYYTDHEPV